MSLPEKKGWAIYRSLDVSYVFVVFGGYIGAFFFRVLSFEAIEQKLTLFFLFLFKQATLPTTSTSSS